MLRRFLALLLLTIVAIPAMAQDTLTANGRQYQFIAGMTDTIKSNGATYIVKYVTEPEMADNMRKNGKIYIVVMVLATIFAGIFSYLVALDRKIAKAEK